MNCTDARDRLAGLVYGDLTPPEAAAVEVHLASCAGCRHEYAALRHVRSLLDVVPTRSAAVDMPRLYEQAARVRGRQFRRWRVAALAAGAAAAALLLALGLRWELRIDAHQLTLRWGAPPEIAAPVPAPAVVRREPADAAMAAEDVRLIKDLIHALADDIEARDQRQQQALQFLQARLTELRLQDQQRWTTTARQVAALSAQFEPSRKE